jgi:hypothetical protein
VTAGAKRREPRRGWRARAAPQDHEEHAGDFEGGASDRRWSSQFRAEEPAARRDLVRSRRGHPRLNPRSCEGTLAQMTRRGAAVGEGPLRGPRGGWARGPL